MRNTPTRDMKSAATLDFPQGDVQLPNWAPYQMSGAMDVLLLPDLHLPYHDRTSLLTAVEYGRKRNVDVLLLNGDQLDFYQISKFNRDPRARKWVDEIKLAHKFFAFIRQAFPKASIIYKLGNHDERYDTFMQAHCPELIGLDTFELYSVLQLADYGITMVKDKQPIRLGHLNVIHGHEYRFAISNPVNPARGLFLKAGAYAICSHFHQKSEHNESNIEGKAIATWSTGCLCDLHPGYMPINKWSHGFAFIEVFADGKFQVENRKVSHGKIY